MSKPLIGFAGMTHLGLVSSIVAAQKGFNLVCYDPDSKIIEELTVGNLQVSEPQLKDLFYSNKEYIFFTSDASMLEKCDLVYVAPDVMTNDAGKSDLSHINSLLNIVFDATRGDATIVVLSQVPPGFTRSRQRPGRALFYQVETLIFGRAVDRALFPERYIVGCADPSCALPKHYENFLRAYKCPLLLMRYESAELAKISINMFLVSTISTTNTIAELCEKIGADWAEIAPALKLDKRIGPHAYLKPGLGVSGGNLERDLATFCNLANEQNTDAGVVNSWIANSRHRKTWAANILRTILNNYNHCSIIAVWGLAYKENTHSTKNSPSIAAISALNDFHVRAYDPIVSWRESWHPSTQFCSTPMDALDNADALMIMTPWPEFLSISPSAIAERMKGRLILDPYGLLDEKLARSAGLEIYTIGRSH
jgi:UDPglucose 6-dehydrogenase